MAASFVKLGNHETAIIHFFFNSSRQGFGWKPNTYRIIEINDNSRGQSSESVNYVLHILINFDILGNSICPIQSKLNELL